MYVFYELHNTLFLPQEIEKSSMRTYAIKCKNNLKVQNLIFIFRFNNY